MRELYNEFFHIPKHGKIREKVMLTRVAMAIAIMVMCLAAMSITAYAYFSYNITSGSNTIKAANFDVQITVKNKDGVTVTPSSTDGKEFIFKNSGPYTVKLEKGNSTAEKGFCIVYIGNKEYYTAQIGVDVKRDLSGENDVEFTLNVPSDTVMKILSHWGTSSYYGYEDEKTNGKVSYIDSSNTTIDLTTSTTDVGEPQSNGEQGSTYTTPSTYTTKPAETTPPETTGTGGETGATEPSNTTEPETQSTEPDPEATEPEKTTETTETQPIDETTGEPTTEAGE